MQKLYETYERCAGHEPPGVKALQPIGHTTQQAQVEIVLDGNGTFRRASVLERADSTTMIPCTEESGGRAGSMPVNHPLCDKLQYVAGDYIRFGGEVTSGFASDPQAPHRNFLASLSNWAESEYQHPRLQSILRYVRRGEVVADLVNEKILMLDANGKLLKQCPEDKSSAPAIFKVIQNTQAPEDAFVRWKVEDDNSASLADDTALIAAWISYYQQTQTARRICMVTGMESVAAVQHPAKLRHAGDKAKLISSNDTSGFTFRGRFLDSDQAATVSFEVTQKAHNALRWLIERQSFRKGDPTVVSWAVPGTPLPSPLDSTLELFNFSAQESASDASIADTEQTLALQLAKAIAGYQAKLDPSDHVMVMALDSATPGRMGITFYRELKRSEFLERVQGWHRDFAWPQNFGKNARFVGAPAPRDIAEAAYGKRLDDKLRKTTIERLLPCIVDGRLIPRDLVVAAIRHAANRQGFKDSWEWDKCLGIACALFKGSHKERNFRMALEQDRNTRDYLYGRLLAIAENIESYALFQAGEKRGTTAARLMQRFADRPSPTWRNIELALRPYIARLGSSERSRGFVINRQRLLDEIVSSFTPSEFTDNKALSGEFLLGYHCQREALHHKSASDAPSDQNQGDNE